MKKQNILAQEPVGRMMQDQDPAPTELAVEVDMLLGDFENIQNLLKKNPDNEKALKAMSEIEEEFEALWLKENK